MIAFMAKKVPVRNERKYCIIILHLVDNQENISICAIFVLFVFELNNFLNVHFLSSIGLTDLCQSILSALSTSLE